jgi:putative CocE/NonD family hydrolase
MPRAQTHDVVCERDLRVRMDDGTTLLADRWVGRVRSKRAQPTVLVRSPYGRRQVVGLLFGRLLAERGLQVVIQSVRGTFGSQGEFRPFDERADGLATLRWVREQPWHSGRIGMIGPSYLGLVQWAVAPEAGDDLAALAIQVSASQFHGQTHAGGECVARDGRLVASACLSPGAAAGTARDDVRASPTAWAAQRAAALRPG